MERRLGLKNHRPALDISDPRLVTVAAADALSLQKSRIELAAGA
jgi:hypothetical protein